MKKISINPVFTALILLMISFVIQLILPTDPTDSGRFDRSGMSFYKDHDTGCQYLAGGGFFGKQVLIPRVDKDGEHICE